MKKLLITTFVICLIFIIFIGLFGFSNVKTIYVGIGEDYSKIQDAINNASNGDTIFIKTGIYYERVVINKSINLVGEGKEKTVIRFVKNNDTNSKNILQVNSNGCNIKNIKIIGAGTHSDIVGINVNSSNNVILKSAFIDNNIGINLNDKTENNIITTNQISNNFYGISLHRSIDNNISKNNITSSYFYGIYVFNTNDNTIYKNRLSDNFYGLKIKASDGNLILKNKIINNIEGIDLCCGSSDNTIYLNIFKENTNSANDELFNQWDNGHIGNYWDDYIGQDEDNDGIGDAPYNITSYEIFDNYPLMDIPLI